MAVIQQCEQKLPFWCQKIVASDSYVILDTKTTGKHGEIIEIAIIDSQGHTLLNQLLQPSMAIEELASRIHRITPMMLLHAPGLQQVWPAILACLQGKQVITYNAYFDYRRIEYSANLYNLILPDWPFHCMMMAYADHWRAPLYKNHHPWQKLGSACCQQNVDLSLVTSIRALGDAQMTLALIQRLAELGPAAPTYQRAHPFLPSLPSMTPGWTPSQPYM
jgi:DNA polymerase III epsilon subunit-like protein